MGINAHATTKIVVVKMGRQINFYMLPEDEKEFISDVLQRKDVVMIAEPFESKFPNIISSLPEPFSKPFWHSIYFWTINGKLETKYIEKQGYFLIDSLTSPVIEFSRSFMRDNLLVRGRIRAQLQYWKSNEIVSKGKEFENWFNAIARWIRKHYQKISELEYIGPHALEWRKRGGVLKDALYKSVL